MSKELRFQALAENNESVSHDKFDQEVKNSINFQTVQNPEFDDETSSARYRKLVDQFKTPTQRLMSLDNSYVIDSDEGQSSVGCVSENNDFVRNDDDQDEDLLFATRKLNRQIQKQKPQQELLVYNEFLQQNSQVKIAEQERKVNQGVLNNLQQSQRMRTIEVQESEKFTALAYINKDGAPLGKFDIELDS